MAKFPRTNIRLPRTSYTGRQSYFLTACTDSRLPRFSDDRFVSQQIELLRETAGHQGFALQAFCFMPDHLHLLVTAMIESADVLRFAKQFKQTSGFAFKSRYGQRLWQHRVYDHVLRPLERWQAIAWYIWLNPVRKGLCGRAEDWPYSGSETVDWRRLVKPPEKWTPPWKQ